MALSIWKPHLWNICWWKNQNLHFSRSKYTICNVKFSMQTKCYVKKRTISQEKEASFSLFINKNPTNVVFRYFVFRIGFMLFYKFDSFLGLSNYMICTQFSLENITKYLQSRSRDFKLWIFWRLSMQVFDDQSSFNKGIWKKFWKKSACLTCNIFSWH